MGVSIRTRIPSYPKEVVERLTPNDLASAKIPVKFRGYDRTDVDTLLDRAAQEMTTLKNELEQAVAAIQMQHEELEAFHSQEHTLKEALMLASRASDEVRGNAQREAGAILDAARKRSKTLEEEAQTRLNDLRWEIEKMQLEKQRFVGNFRAMLEEHLRELSDHYTFAVVEGNASDPVDIANA